MTVIELHKDEFKEEFDQIAKELKSGARLNAIVITELEIEEGAIEPDVEVICLNVTPGRLVKGMLVDAMEVIAQLTAPIEEGLNTPIPR